MIGLSTGVVWEANILAVYQGDVFEAAAATGVSDVYVWLTLSICHLDQITLRHTTLKYQSNKTARRDIVTVEPAGLWDPHELCNCRPPA